MVPTADSRAGLILRWVWSCHSLPAAYPGTTHTGRQSDLGTHTGRHGWTWSPLHRETVRPHRHNRTQSPPHRQTRAPIQEDAVRSRNHLTQADTVDPGITYTGRLSWTWETSPCPPPVYPLSPHPCTHSDTALAPQSNTFPAKSPRTRASCRSSQPRVSRAPTTDWKHLRAAPFSFCFTYGQHWP